MNDKFYYSKSLKLFISLEPLKINEKILNIGKKLGIKLSWNDSGIINYINYCEAKEILKELNSYMLSPKEFFKVINDAREEGRVDVIKALTSKEYVEWLDAVFIKEDDIITSIEHPKLKATIDNYEFIGDKVITEMVEGRPGWIDYTGEKDNLGLPIEVYKNFGQVPEKSNIWKYWSVNQKNAYVSPIRGYVLSSGTPSLDIDIPFIARQPVLTVRECKKQIEINKINDNLINFYNEINNDYNETITNNLGENNREDVDKFYFKWSEKLTLIESSILTEINELSKIRKEKLIDILGLLNIVAISKNSLTIIKRIENITKYISNKEVCISMNNIREYLRKAPIKLKEAYKDGKEIIFVMGHENPDTDTVISSIFEAYRNTIVNEDKLYIPIIQSKLIPDEVEELLGKDICKYLILYNNELYKEVKESGYGRWILVDHNICDVQRYVVSIVDHHILSEKVKKTNIPITWEMLGSTTALITLKLLVQGIKIKEDVARVLYAATLMDTENRNKSKVSYKDTLIMDYLKELSRVSNDDLLFQGLMDKLLKTNDIELLFNRDYKEDWGIFGYSVAKVKGVFTEDGEVNRPELFVGLREFANKNNEKNNFSVTLVKVVDYKEDNETVNRERLYFIYNTSATEKYKNTLLDYAELLINDQFNGESNLYKGEDYIEYWGTGIQLSRKFTAPYLEPVIKAFNEYFYSPSINLYVKREFMQISDKLKEIANEKGIALKYDDLNRVNYISFEEAKELVKAQNQRLLTLSEYWKVLKDAKELNDTQMVNHLKSKDFVEMLDTVIIDSKYIINNCSFNKETGEVCGDKFKSNILEAVPALISMDDIDIKSGLPYKLEEANQYNNKNLWRYWSPDSNICIATRGHIFLLDQCALDTKIHLDDRLPNLGVRQCSFSLDVPVIKYKGKVIS